MILVLNGRLQFLKLRPQGFIAFHLRVITLLVVFLIKGTSGILIYNPGDDFCHHLHLLSQLFKPGFFF